MGKRGKTRDEVPKTYVPIVAGMHEPSMRKQCNFFPYSTFASDRDSKTTAVW
jgi:hypothetical protein